MTFKSPWLEMDFRSGHLNFNFLFDVWHSFHPHKAVPDDLQSQLTNQMRATIDRINERYLGKPVRDDDLAIMEDMVNDDLNAFLEGLPDREDYPSILKVHLNIF